MPTMVERLLLKLDGLLEAGVTSEFAVESFSWGITSVADATGGGGGAGRPQLTNLQLTRPIDQFSPALFRAAANSQRLPSGVLTFTRVGGGATETITYALTDLAISTYNHSGNQHGGIPTEGMSLSFARLALNVNIQNLS